MSRARRKPHNEEFSSDNDDIRSVTTIIPHELERADEEDEAAAAEHEDRWSSCEVGRLRTPGPSLVVSDDDEHH